MERCRVRLTQIALRYFKRLKKFGLLWNLKKSHPLLCCFLEPLTTKYSRVWRSVINFVDRFHKVEEKSSLYQGEGLIIMTSKRRGGEGHNAAILSMPYLKVLLIVWSHKTFKLIFLKQPSWPKNRELAWAPILGNFFILLEQQSCGTPMKSCLLNVLLYFQSKIKFWHSIWWTSYFDFLFWFNSAILLSEMKSLFFNLSTNPCGTNLCNH